MSDPVPLSLPTRPSAPAASERAVSNFHARRVMLAIQDVMGHSGLIGVLRQSGLQRYVGALPPPTAEPGLRAGEYAALLQAIENYFGRGARGTLTRIGHAAFQHLLRARRPQAVAYGLLFRVLPTAQRRRLALGWLGRALGGQVSLHTVDGQLVLLDHGSAGTFGRSREAAICWVTLGEIQEALQWSTGEDYEVTEAACRAQGQPACRFVIGGPLS